MYKIAIIGCGRQAPGHLRGYLARPDDCEVAALCDVAAEGAAAFRDQHGPTGARLYTDYREMLASEKPDVVSICTWPALHAPMTVACAEAGVKAVHCEKPMAPTFGEARAMVEACEKAGTQLTFNHQRRFAPVFNKVRSLVEEGAIGALERIELSCGNLFDWGTHWFDMAFFYTRDAEPVEWVIGQIDVRDARVLFGAPLEGQGVCHWKFRSGVRGQMLTGFDAPSKEGGVEHRLVGSDGVIELTGPKGFGLRMWGKGQSGWTALPDEGGINGGGAVPAGIGDLIDALKAGREPELSGRRALRATELIFAAYESSRRRGRVDLPLSIDDSPLADLIGQRDAAARTELAEKV